MSDDIEKKDAEARALAAMPPRRLDNLPTVEVNRSAFLRGPVVAKPDLEARTSQIGPHTLKKVGWMLKVFLDDPDVTEMRIAKSAATTAPKTWDGEDERVRIVKAKNADGVIICGPASTADIEKLDTWEAELAALDAL